MSARLSQEDRQAVDLLLDRSPTAGTGAPVFASAPGSGERVARVQKLLHLLDAMPQVEPPKNLVGRTLRFIDEAAQHPIGRQMPNLIDTQRPVV